MTPEDKKIEAGALFILLVALSACISILSEGPGLAGIVIWPLTIILGVAIMSAVRNLIT